VTFIDEVRNDRADLARVLKKHHGIRRIVEELYPDSAHFIYELLQNAEDVNATHAAFGLSSDGLTFVHNGRSFEERDIWAITDIGEGAKVDDDDKIGRFGVGFKAVFAYCDTPSIWSPTYSFKIADLVLPHEIPARPDIGGLTRFEFPFNNSKKAPAVAYREVLAGLEELAEHTLLFLIHMESIHWTLGGDVNEIARVKHSAEHIEIKRRVNGETTKSAHFLRFLEPAAGAERQNVAVAFDLELLPEAGTFDPARAMHEQVRIAPANPGRVAVFFPAEKETSGLRFHVHAPFVPELSRASVKETPVNEPLFAQLADVTARSLHRIRDLGLLVTDFMGVLPNPQDVLPERYQQIREAIVEAMREQSLTPTYARGHAPARTLVQGEASLKALLSEEDIEFLIDYDEEAPKWAVSAPQRNTNADRFLSGLAVRSWDAETFVGALSERASITTRWVTDPPRFVSEPDAEFMSWLSTKPVDWHQAMYALVTEHLNSIGYRRSRILEGLRSAGIVRLRSGRYATGDRCFFGSASEDDELMPRVDPNVYTSGKSKTQHENAKRLLTDLGVREVGEVEQIEVILKHRYVGDSIEPDPGDLARFVEIVERKPETATMFGNYFIFQASDGDWMKPSQAFLDLPYLDTGMKEYYERLEDGQSCFALSDRYLSGSIDPTRFTRFAVAVGARIRLEPMQTTVTNNPQAPYLYSAGGQRHTSPMNEDYVVPGLKDLLNEGNIRLSRLVWRSLNDVSPHCLRAAFRRNQASGMRVTDSQLVHDLSTARWVPQTDGTFVHPGLASSDLLPEGFSFDAGKAWIKAVRFGERLAERVVDNEKKREALRAIGVRDERSLDRWKRFSQCSEEEQEEILAEIESRKGVELSDSEPKNPSRRSERVQQAATSAPDRGSELKVRSVAERRDAIHKEADPYLMQEYRSADGVMICQAGRHELPFKLLDGSYYFESVEIVTRMETAKHHKQNYLCLCPNHAAMFRYANPVREQLREKIESMNSQELKLELAGKVIGVFFTKRHKLDLQAALKADPRPASRE
jgi:hypothetical protein